MPRSRLFSPVLAAAGLAVLLAGPALAGREVITDGVLHIVNGPEPAQGVQTVDLQEVWRVGGEDGEDFFGMISQVVIGEEGNIYLLDTRLSEVPVYSPSGERVATLSREGEGPGETRIPSNLMFMPDGTLGLAQVFPGKVTKITTDGIPAGIFQPGAGDATAGGLLQLFDCAVLDGNVVVSAESISQIDVGQERTNFVATFAADGTEQVRFWDQTYTWDFTNFELDEGRFRLDFRRFAVSPDGRLFVATSRDAYELTVFNPDGTVDRVIEREFTVRPRTGEEKDDIYNALEAAIQAPFEVKITVAETHPTIGWVSLGPDGNIWVLHSRSSIDQPEGVMQTVDVFDPDGHLVRQVAARCEGDGEEDILIWTPQGSVVHVTGYMEALRSLQGAAGAGEDEDEEEAAPMEVIYLTTAET